MDDKSQIEALYIQMYRAMVEKDTVTLDEQHADEFVLTRKWFSSSVIFYFLMYFLPCWITMPL